MLPRVRCGSLSSGPPIICRHMAEHGVGVSGQERAEAATISMMRGVHQHVLDGGGLELGCAYSHRCYPFLYLSDSGDWCDSLCHVAKTMTCCALVSIRHDHLNMGNRQV